MTFLLDARLDLDPEEQDLFAKYNLNDILVYDSDARVQSAHSAHESFEAADKSIQAVPIFPAVSDIPAALGNIAASIWHYSTSATHLIASHLSLRITLGSLVQAQHFETESLEEILAVRRNIEEAVEYLANYFTLALTFDGREDLSEH